MAAAKRKVYIDSSAYLCYLLGEHGREDVERKIKGAVLCSSILLLIESRRNLIRMSRQGIIGSGEFTNLLRRVGSDAEQFIFYNVTPEHCDTTPIPVVMVPRSLDLIHVRTALAVHKDEQLLHFISLDDAQLNAASELGLPV